jgi:hypothetical protein
MSVGVNLLNAIFDLMRRPGCVALAPPNRMMAFNDRMALQQLGGRKPDYARLYADDFMREDWEVVTPQQLEALAQETGGEPGQSDAELPFTGHRSK